MTTPSKRTTLMQNVELRTNLPLREALIEAYRQTGKVDEAARYLGISYPIYWDWRMHAVDPPITEKELEEARAAALAEMEREPAPPAA